MRQYLSDTSVEWFSPQLCEKWMTPFFFPCCALCCTSAWSMGPRYASMLSDSMLSVSSASGLALKLLVPLDSLPSHHQAQVHRMPELCSGLAPQGRFSGVRNKSVQTSVWTNLLLTPALRPVSSHQLLIVSPAESSQPQTRQGICVDQGAVLYEAIRN